MTNQKQIRKRVKSIKNIGKITSALEMVAASRVQKAQDAALRSKPYADKVYELVSAVSGERENADLPLLRQPESVNRDLYILISSNKGLAGSLNTNLLGSLKKHLDQTNIPHSFITLGIKGRNLTLKYGDLVADFSEIEPFYKNIPSVVDTMSDLFISGQVDRVYLVYSDFKTIMTQEPTIKQLLPIVAADSEAISTPYVFEPTSREVLENLLVFYIENQVRDAMHEAEASEHAARMIAMKNASDNAHDLSDALSLEYNKVRQSAITTEISDIVTSKVSLEK